VTVERASATPPRWWMREATRSRRPPGDDVATRETMPAWPRRSNRQNDPDFFVGFFQCMCASPHVGRDKFTQERERSTKRFFHDLLGIVGP
jgi:hypothetical protein